MNITISKERDHVLQLDCLTATCRRSQCQSSKVSRADGYSSNTVNHHRAERAAQLCQISTYIQLFSPICLTNAKNGGKRSLFDWKNKNNQIQTHAIICCHNYLRPCRIRAASDQTFSSDLFICDTKMYHSLNSNLLNFPQSRLGGTLHSDTKPSRQLFSVLPPPLLLQNWPVLHWLYRLTLPSSCPLHHPAVAPLTCKEHSQKPVGGLDGLCRLHREQLHYPQIFLVLTHNKYKTFLSQFPPV